MDINYSLFIGGLLLFTGQSLAVDKVEERYISQLVNGGATSMRSAAESMFHTGVTNREVLDVAAEVLLQRYEQQSSSRTDADALAWVCRAIGNSGDGRYRTALQQVADDSSQKSMKKHCGKGYKSLSQADIDQYAAGGVSLAAYQQVAEKAEPDMDKLSATGKETLASGEHPFSLVREGMSMEEVHDLVGYESNMTSHITGKAFIPFYRGGDSARTVGLYKGLGRIIYSRKGAYSSTWRVVSVEQDNSEAGYR